MQLIKKPFFWSSAHRETTFTFDFESLEVDGVFSFLLEEDATGKLSFLYTGPVFTGTPTAGQYIYVDSGIYKGYHLITGFAGISGFFAIYTDTDWTANQLTGNVKHITSGVFEIYAGYSTGDLATLLPYTKIAEFRSEANVDGYLEVNISGYLKKLFDVINSNELTTVGAIEVYYNTFTQFEVLLNGASIFTGITLNASITQYELNRDYVGTGRSLNSGNLGNHVLSCGLSEIIVINGSYVTRTQFDQAISTPLPDFATPDFVTGDFKTS